MATRRTSIRSLSSASSSSRELIRWANEDSDALVAAVTGSESDRDEALSLRRPGRAPRDPSSGNEAVQGRCSRGGASGPRPCPWPGGRSAWRRRGPGWPRRHRLSTWACPWPDHSRRPGRLRWRRGDRTCHCAGVLAIRPVDLEDLDAHPAQVTGQARAIGPGALDADLGDVTEGLEPAQQCLVAGELVSKRSVPSSPPSGSRAAATWTSRCVSTPPVTPRAASTMVMVIPSLYGVEGWHGRSGSERRGSGLFVATGPITPTRRRDVPSVNVPLVGLGRRRIATSRDSKSDRTCQHSRSYSGPAIKRWTLREVSMYWGIFGQAFNGGDSWSRYLP